MQLGLTLALQKHLKLEKQIEGEPEDLFYCWELDILRYQGKNSLLLVNASNRFLICLSGMKNADWMDIESRIIEGITAGFASEGYTKEQIEEYFELAGEMDVVKTHGKRVAATLHRAIDYLTSIDEEINHEQLYQAYHSSEVNRELCSAAGHKAYGLPVEFLQQDMKKAGIID